MNANRYNSSYNSIRMTDENKPNSAVIDDYLSDQLMNASTCGFERRHVASNSVRWYERK